jgi:hypothetical protein
MVLETEIAAYNELLPALLERGEGKFVVIAGQTLVGIFDSNDAGYSAGLEAVGLAPFLLRKIQRTQPIAFLPTIFVSGKVG